MNKALTKRGFTLVELILVIGMIAIIGIATVGMLHDSHAIWQKTSKRSTLLQDSQAAMEQMLRILRQAKSFDTISASTEEAGSVVFTDVDNITTQFSRDAVDDELDYGEPGDLNALAGGVSSLVFTCYDIDGAALSDPVDVSDIQSVEVNATFTDPDDSSISFTLSGRVFCATDPVTLITRWPLNETSGFAAEDIAGSNDGTLTNMNGNEWTGGVVGGALEFDGTNDYVEAAGLLDEPANVTICAWLNLTSSSWAADVISLGDYVAIRLDDETPGFGFTRAYYYTGSVWRNTSSGIILKGTGWRHVAYVVDDTNNSQKFYIDGAVLGSTSYTESISYSGLGSNTTMGVHGGNENQFFFGGKIDDVRIYNRVLSAEEIAQLANVLRYREFTEAKAGSDTTSLTISTPADTSEGDLLIAAVATDGDTSASLAPPGGEGWTAIDIGHYSSGVTLGAWWKNADASESATHEFTWSPDETAYGWMMRFTGHDPSAPINDWAANGASSSTPTSPAVTSTVNYALIVRLGAFDDGDITVDDPGLSGHTAITMDMSGPAGWWKLDEASGLTAADSSGNGNDGTLENMAGNEWTTGQIDGALDLDGIDDYIDCGNALDYGIDDSCSISAWIKTTDTREFTIVSKANHLSPFQGIWFYTYNSYLYGYMYDDSGNFIAAWGDNTSWVDGNWHNIILTYDGSGAWTGFKVYIDASAASMGLSGSGTDTVGTVTNSYNCTIGATNGSAYFCDGTIDDVRIYNRVLSADEITALAAGSGGGSAPVSGGAGWLSQLSSGSSGTSTFSLTASQEAQLLTIAITPDPDSGSQ